MAYSSTRLDRLLSSQLGMSKKAVRRLLAQGQVRVDHQPARQMNIPIRQFTHVAVGEQLIQNNPAYYVMLNKPKGIVSATRDPQHKTVIDLLPYSFRHELHIAGRLDLNSTGLVLLSNDGRWSRSLSEAKKGVIKKYHVRLAKPLNSDYVKAFAQGMYFPYEDIHTRPVELKILSEFEAELSLEEGRYHQIKRMFGRFRNPVLALHRSSIGAYPLPKDLGPGDSRQFCPDEYTP